MVRKRGGKIKYIGEKSLLGTQAGGGGLYGFRQIYDDDWVH